MKSIKKMVEEALLDNITDSDIEEAVQSIIEEMDISDLLAESYALKDAVYNSVSELIDNVVEMYN